MIGSSESSGEAGGSKRDIPLDLMCGIGGRYIRILCDNPLNGGLGIPITEVGKMTLDQIAGMLCEKEALSTGDRRRITSKAPMEVVPDKDGFIKGRAEDGTQIRGRVMGKSKVKLILEQQAREAEAAAKRQRAEKREARKLRRSSKVE